MASIPSLREILIEVQDSQNVHPLLKAFQKVYKAIPHEEFSGQFFDLIKHVLIIYNREPAVEKTVDFIAKAVTDMAISESKIKKKKSDDKAEGIEEEEDDEEDEMHPLLLALFEFLLDVHSAKEKGIRFRVCQLVTKLLQNLGEGARIDDDLYDRIYSCMLERLRDKSPQVRVHAVLALSRLQDPTDQSCPIIKAYMILMTRDPNMEVRRIILACIAPSTVSLPAILERTRDIKDVVRRTAFTVIAEKIPLRALSIDQRVKLLETGLSDRSEPVKAACANKLLQSWLISCEANVLDLLTRLDVQSSVDVCEKALNVLFKSSTVFDLVEKFDVINDNILINEEKLTGESAFYWRALVQFIYGQGNEFEEQLDRIRPNCVEYCSYVKNFSKQLASCSDMDKMLDLEFTMQQLLQMFAFMDLSDTAGRKTLEKLLHDLLVSENIGPSLIAHILPCVRSIKRDPSELNNYIAETISEIREPFTTVETQISKEESRNVDKKIAGIRVKVNQLREELAESVEKQDFERAAQIKLDISNLDAEKNSLLDELQPRQEEVRTVKDDPLTILKCLTIITELLATTNVRALTPVLQQILDSEVLPGMTSVEAEVRQEAVKAIGLFCLIKRDIVMQHLPVLLQAMQMDTLLVRTTALKAIFDIIHVFGPEAFNDGINQTGSDAANDTNASQEDEGDKSKSNDTGDDSTIANESAATHDASANLTTASAVAEEDKKGWSEAATKVITILSSTLDSEYPELRSTAAEGFSKLFLSGRFVSSKLLSHLLLLWYNPLIEDDEQLVQCLGIFFPIFAFSGSENQELIEEAFLPTLRTLLRAPTTSPLAEVNEINVANFLVEITDARNLVANQKSPIDVTENPCHDSLAVKLCNEILSHPDSFGVKLWLRILNILCLSPENKCLFKDILKLCDKMGAVVTEKQCIKYLDQFRNNTTAIVNALEEKEEKERQANTSDEVGPGDNETTPKTAPARAEGNVVGEEETSGGGASAARSAKVPTTGRRSKKTPALPRSTHIAGGRSVHRSTTKKQDTSGLDDSVFVTPRPLRGSRMTAEVDDVAINLENLLVSGTSKTPARVAGGKTPKTPKRPLHTIQDPAFTG